MFRVVLKSSGLGSAGYEEKSHTLEIEFLTGHIYHYHEVPKKIANEFIHNPPGGSHGKYFLDYIRDVYECERIE